MRINWIHAMLDVDDRPVLFAHFPELACETGDVLRALKAGLPTSRLDALREELEVGQGEITELLGIATSTLARRRQRGTLERGESERVYRLAHLYARAAQVFGSRERARAWLKKPQYALGGMAPLSYADTEPGAREVEHLLGRIEHGIPA